MAQNTALKKPTRVQQAQGRLDQAVARLESALAERGPALGGSAGAETGDETGAQVAALRAEVDQLTSQNAELKRVNDHVAGRLDTVIDNLKSSLDA